MRPGVAAAERNLEVREAAAGWRAAGAIDEPTLRTVEAAYPDDRVRLKFWIRVLAFAATIVGVVALGAFLALLFRVNESAHWFVAAMAVACVVATEFQTGPLRRAQCGSESATALLAALFTALLPVLWWSESSWSDWFAGGTVVCAIGSWRWGSVILAGASATSAFALVARWPNGRILWLLLAALLVPLAYLASRSIRFAPSHRRSAEVVAAASLIAAYVAISLYALDRSWVEVLGSRAAEVSPTWMRVISAAGTALLPIALLAAGVVLRNRIGLLLGAAFTAASLATLRSYYSIGPLWLCLTVGGGACLAIALGLRHWLSTAPGKERSGFTSEPLFESVRGREAAKIAVAIATLGPSPRTAPASATPGPTAPTAPERSFEGGGGLSGGGGASGTS
jgi:hypothetical protein